MKYCNNCREYREDSEFNKHGEGRVQSWCRSCTTEYSRKWYKANREKHIEYVGRHRPRKVHVCKHCGRGEPEVQFYIRKVGERCYRRFLCYECDQEHKKRYPTTEAAKQRHRERRAATLRVNRKTKEKRYRYILADSRKQDRTRGMVNDLDLEFVRDAILSGCSYCGDDQGKMTLDRTDNSVGHLKSNVVPACARCNWIRRDMPYKAWLCIAPAVREARLLGLLDGWHAGPHRATVETPSSIDIAILSEL